MTSSFSSRLYAAPVHNSLGGEGVLGAHTDVCLPQVCGVTDTICVLYAVSLGFGRHTADVLAEPGGAARAVTAAKIQMIAYRTSSNRVANVNN